MPAACTYRKEVKTQSVAGHDLRISTFAAKYPVTHKPAVKRMAVKEYESYGTPGKVFFGRISCASTDNREVSIRISYNVTVTLPGY